MGDEPERLSIVADTIYEANKKRERRMAVSISRFLIKIVIIYNLKIFINRLSTFFMDHIDLAPMVRRLAIGERRISPASRHLFFPESFDFFY